MANRFKSITDPEGNTIDTYRSQSSAYIEKLDGRNPLYKHYKYRFSIRSVELTTKFLKWMNDNFGPSMNHSLARHNVKCNVSLDAVPWVLQTETRSYYSDCHIYFNKECEVLIRLNFMQGSTL
jgi:hypothetical protein